VAPESRLAGAGPSNGGDLLTPFVFERAQIRGAIVQLSDVSRGILACHAYPPAVARALGELLAATALLAGTGKLDGSLVAQLRGDGPLSLLVVECDGSLALRATAQWDDKAVAALPGDASLAALAGSPAAARLAITLDPRGSGNLYQGIVALQFESIAASIEHYLATSEQLQSRLRLDLHAARATGVLVQRLPASTDDDEDTWQRAEASLAAVPSAALRSSDAVGVLRALFPRDDLRVFTARTARFQCKCSLERARNALRIAGAAEVEAALAEQGKVEVTCEYCGRVYPFDPAAARALFGPAPRQERR
jgi:molecular chaperone Hsp33